MTKDEVLVQLMSLQRKPFIYSGLGGCAKDLCSILKEGEIVEGMMGACDRNIGHLFKGGKAIRSYLVSTSERVLLIERGQMVANLVRALDKTISIPRKDILHIKTEPISGLDKIYYSSVLTIMTQEKLYEFYIIGRLEEYIPKGLMYVQTKGNNTSEKSQDVSGEGRRFCSECGMKLKEGAKFCPECGSSVVKQRENITTDVSNAEKTVRGIIFDSIDEAEIFKREIEEYEKIYLQGSSYADYESQCLEEILERLKSQNFKSINLIEKISELENELLDRKEHETVENLQWRQKFIDSFSDIEDENLYLYRKNEEFLEEAYTAKNTEIMKQNQDKYPIVIYDTHAKPGGISGFVLSESALYDYTSFWGNRVLDFKDVQNIAYSEEKITIFILTTTGKTHKLKLNSFSKVKEISTALSMAVLNRTAACLEIQGLTEQMQGLLNNEKNIFSTRVKGENALKTVKQNETKQCHNCGSLTNLDAKFCKQCGAKFEVYNTDDKCHNCGNLIKEEMKFCPVCGEKLIEN